MITDNPTLDRDTIERLVSQVRGVTAVRAVHDEQGQLAELHVVGSPERSAKAIIRDAESILYVRGRMRINHRKISLVQVDDAAIHIEPIRVQLLGVDFADAPHAITVTLGNGSNRYQGIGTVRTDIAGDTEVLAGYATIHALEQLIGGRGHLRLENLQHQSFGSLEICLAHITLTAEDRIETLLGVSTVRETHEAATVRAILDAVNRRLTHLLQGE